jgi:hypothetical protein
MRILTPEIFATLRRPGQRLPSVIDWLGSEVWTQTRFESLDPESYLSEGERRVYQLEELLSAAADRFYDELASAAAQKNLILDTFSSSKPTAFVIFDGTSLREVPLFLRMAAQSGYSVMKQGITYSGLPSNTIEFVEQRLLGKAVTPKELPQRKELKERRIRAYYYDAPIRTHHIPGDETATLILWSAFPDVTYQDSGARFARHFAELIPLFETAWKSTVMQVPRDYRIIVTSDHGYIFFGAGLASPRRSQDALNVLDQDRSKRFSDSERLPDPHPDLQILPERRLAMLRGRVKNRPKGPAGNRLYRHGGLSLMEVLLPWLVLERNKET